MGAFLTSVPSKSQRTILPGNMDVSTNVSLLGLMVSLRWKESRSLLVVVESSMLLSSRPKETSGPLYLLLQLRLEKLENGDDDDDFDAESSSMGWCRKGECVKCCEMGD